ncbi:hypothetical protein [Lentibacillus saliphilus]|uniref:hypothetical protein n=1 Tax=Lentibacillus saliphilus TaxID=2737028 RepID=UPI001C311536|nr:hypothetical protein [Lentibacillus saliphilus]
MSDDKKVIHVKDLVIKAENVHIEPTRKRHRDPFFRRPQGVEAAEESSERDYSREDDESSDRDHRKPFSWL